MKEYLIWAQHVRKWEIAHTEWIDANGITVPREMDGVQPVRRMWVRRDMSTLCAVCDEIAFMAMPDPPAPAAAALAGGQDPENP